jgi:hypothetical protein
MSTLILISVVAILLWLLSVPDWKRASRRRQRLTALGDAWGKQVERTRDWSVHGIVRELRGAEKEYSVDDQTSQDLNLDLVFSSLDRTLSLPGEIELYRILRSPLTDVHALHKRDQIISLFEKDEAMCAQVQLELAELGRTQYAYGLFELLWGELPPRNPLMPLYSLLALLVVTSLFVIVGMATLGLRWHTFALFSFTVLFLINLCFHIRTRRNMGAILASIRYLSKLVTAARLLAQARLPGLEEMNGMLDKCVQATRRIPRTTALLVPERGGSAEWSDVIGEYFAILFLIEVRGFYSLVEQIRKCREPLVKLFETLGELDALQAIASFREGLHGYAKPSFPSDRLMLEVDGAFHPLLASPVPNSISLEGRGCVITGSNMSGKSTFLRTLGLNAVLAQTIFTCPAVAYKGSLFRVISSLSRTDDLMGGKSCYLMEAERLLLMIRSTETATPALCIIDEVLCGTNSCERLAASEKILEYLAHRNAITIVATHDVELVDRLASSYSSYHFRDHVDDRGLHFDYLLQAGKATTTNAIRLLEFLRYPPEIVEDAQKAAFYGVGPAR